jgi:hypothetical protein
MITDINELKEFILWAKAQKVKSIKLGEIHIELSDLALIEGLSEQSAEAVTRDLSVPPSSPRLPNGNAQANEDDEDLFFSTR